MTRSKRQDLQINRHRKEGTSWRTNLQVSIKEGKKAAVYPGFQAINTPCYILDILISFKTAQGTELSISPFQTPLCDPSAPALHNWPLMKTLLKLKQTKLCQLMTKAWLYWCLFFHTHSQRQDHDARTRNKWFFTPLQSLKCFCSTIPDEGAPTF